MMYGATLLISTSVNHLIQIIKIADVLSYVYNNLHDYSFEYCEESYFICINLRNIQNEVSITMIEIINVTFLKYYTKCHEFLGMLTPVTVV